MTWATKTCGDGWACSKATETAAGQPRRVAGNIIDVRPAGERPPPIPCRVASSESSRRAGSALAEQGVTVIVGLRPYTSKANILPEQTVGRGLRLMFRGATGYIERVDVIGNKTFIAFVEQLEREEDIQLETFRIGEKVSIITIAPDPAKIDKDIALPVLSPILTREKSLAEEIAERLPKGQERFVDDDDFVYFYHLDSFYRVPKAEYNRIFDHFKQLTDTEHNEVVDLGDLAPRRR